MFVLPQRLQIDEMVRLISKRSIAEVERRLSAKVSQMGEAELRGYLRARAIRPVRNEAAIIAQQRGWHLATTDAVVRVALDRVVYMIIHGMKMQPVVATWAADTPTRAAG